MYDLDLLKTVTDADAHENERWLIPDQAVAQVLGVLREADLDGTGEVSLWGSVYDAIKDADGGFPAWEEGSDDE